MATQVMGQSSGGGGLFTGSGSIGMALPNDMYDLHDLSKAELAAPQLIMLANVALTGEVNGSCCDYLVGEERQMAELMPVGDNNFSDSDGEGLEESPEIKEDKCKNLKTKPFQEGDFSKGPIRLLSIEYCYFVNENCIWLILLHFNTVHYNFAGERPYKCELCPYSSSQKTHLTRHMRTHSEESEAVSKTTLPSPSITMAVNESQEIDEDEGIHSHDGSDLSDNMSEGSDDSGLHGARPAPQETSRKNAKEALAVKVSKGDFVCIFCDRSFRKEKDFSKHLNRHLVNVYFLEKAAQGQE
uniref:RE1 silencing transcription factor n=1 Tax=Prolemur simus TaxID=1328070 RepID=A0A8C9A482_PROSS